MSKHGRPVHLRETPAVYSATQNSTKYQFPGIRGGSRTDTTGNRVMVQKYTAIRDMVFKNLGPGVIEVSFDNATWVPVDTTDGFVNFPGVIQHFWARSVVATGTFTAVGNAV